MTRALILATALALAAPAAAEAPSRLRTLFPREAPVHAPGAGLAVLELPPEVLAACRADLSDLRLFDAEGREVPYRLDRGAPTGTVERLVRRWEQAPLDVERESVAREGLSPLLREIYHLAPPPEPGDDPWDLVVETPHRSFVRRVRVEVRGGGESPLVREESVFRLVDPLREKLRVSLPPLGPPLEQGRIVVTLEGDDGFHLSPRLRLETGQWVSARPPTPVELREVGRQTETGRTVVVLARPRGLVPEALRVATSAPAFHRAVEIWDEGPGAGPGPAGRGSVFRVPALTAAEELDVPLRPAAGDRLRVVIHDGDSPALDALSFHALVRRPALVFALPPGTPPGQAGALAFGGGRARPPRYDLEALPLGSPAQGIGAELTAWVRDPAGVPRASLADSRPNPLFDPAPVLAYAMHAGAPVNARLWTHRVPLALAPSADGLSRLRLRPEDLARSRPDLADLRLIDGEGRQWAYLLEPGGEGELRDLALAPSRSRDRTTRYPLRLPVAPATLDRVQLTVGAPFFDRPFELVGTPPGGKTRVLAVGRLARRAGDAQDPAISFPPARLEALEIRVADGDDAPLPLLRAAARFPAPELFVAAPAGAYALLLGNPDAGPPRYEIARARELVLAVEYAVVAPGPVGENPEYSPQARLAAAGGVHRVLLWAALALAVAVLALLTLRAAREGAPGQE